MKIKNKYNVVARAGLLALALTAAFAMNASAITLWYNGDFNGVNGLANEVNGGFGNGADAGVYDNFVGPSTGQSWHVTDLFSDNLISPGFNTSITTANWEIRTGISNGNAGTLLFSGTNAPVTVTATGRSGFGLVEYQVQVTGLNLVLPNLPAGYFLNVTPIAPMNTTGLSYNSTTSGANAVGLPPGNDYNSWFNSTHFGVFFGPAGNQTGDSPDFSMGVLGTVVPEPATVALLTCGVGLLLIAVRRRRSS